MKAHKTAISMEGKPSEIFCAAMGQILSVPKDELAKREASYQQECAAKKASRKSKLSALVRARR